MIISTTGIIFRQIRTGGGRRMLLLFTKDLGKISCGTSLGKNQKSRSQLALHPYTYGNYQIYQGRNYYNLDRAETIRSFYRIGENLDRYAAASRILELTEKVVPEDLPMPQVFDLLIDFFDALEHRGSRFETLTLAYEVKLLRALGSFPLLDRCAHGGEEGELTYFSIPDGGMICEDCARKLASEGQDSLIYKVKFDIVSIIKYLEEKPFQAFHGTALKQEQAEILERIFREYFAYHLEIRGLKSDSVIPAFSKEES